MKYIKREDFGEEFLENFSKENQDYIIQFCNTFQKTFPNILSNAEVIKRIKNIDSISKVESLKDGHNGETIYEPFMISDDDDDIGKMSVKYLSIFNAEEEKNIVYHELLHVLSRTDMYVNGLSKERTHGFYRENVMFDEMMNEYYTTKLLETEGIHNKREYVRGSANFGPAFVEDRYSHYGNGYIVTQQLADFYDRMFGTQILSSKLNGDENFRRFFNEKYKDIQIDLSDLSDSAKSDYPDDVFTTPYEKLQIQLGTKGIIDCYKTAMDIWKLNEKENIENNGFNLYTYLTNTKELISSLPRRIDEATYRNDRGDEGIPPSLYAKLIQMDKDIICQYIKPELKQMTEEEQIRELNTLIPIINILRLNITELSREDIDNVSYGQVEEYTHSGRNCLVVSAGEQDYMTFVANGTEDKTQSTQFSAYSRMKPMSEYKYFTEEQEDKLKESLSVGEQSVRNIIYASVNDVGEFSQYGLVKDERGQYYKTTGGTEKILIANKQKLITNRLLTQAVDITEEQTRIGEINVEIQRIKQIQNVREEVETEHCQE